MTKQAIQLGFLPRMTVVQTSARERGQIYIPGINWLLLAAVLAAVIGFGSSSRLASAYGVAVTATMLVDTLLTFFVIRYALGLSAVAVPVRDRILLHRRRRLLSARRCSRSCDGGWFPLLIGAIVFTVMTHLAAGPRASCSSACARRRCRSSRSSIRCSCDPPQRVPGTAVFLTATPDATPHALLHNLNHNKVLHERVVFLTVEITDEPWVPFQERVRLTKLGHGCWRMNVRYGFMNEPDISQALRDCRHARAGIRNDVDLVLPQPRDRGARWPRCRAAWRSGASALFAAMARNAGNAADYFKLPTNRVIELGTKVEI